jgi:hypothetical protein
MTRRLITVSAVVAASAVVLPAFAAGERDETDSADAKPRLSIDLQPVAVVGTGFKPGETVRIIVRGTAVGSSRSSKASAAGRISVRFPGVRLDECRPGHLIIVTAIGDKGSRAQVRRMPPACGIDPGRAP